MNSHSRLLRFYAGKEPDHRGRQFDALLALGDDAIEHAHDFIQWLFPLETPSPFNPEAPRLTASDAQAFMADPLLVEQAVRALERMLDFYGFDLDEEEDGWHVVPTREAQARFRRWLTPANHNYLRITRILKFMVRIGQPQLARAFWRALAELARHHRGVIGGQTIGFWRDAVESPSPFKAPAS
jgi:hypothetical protein